MASLKAPIASLLYPFLIVCNSEELMSRMSSLADLDDRRDKFFEESRNLEQTGPKVVKKVDEEAFDMRTIVILISHNHDRPVAEILDVCIGLSHKEAHDFYHVLQFLVCENH